MRVFINSGHLSLDNGAIFPFTKFNDLAKLLNVSPNYGEHYYDDSLDIPEAEWPIVEELLISGKMLYRIESQHLDWQNAQSDYVKTVIARVAQPACV